jgi:hypothetical protein
VEELPSRRGAWTALLQRFGMAAPEELEAWWGWSWRDAVVGLPARAAFVLWRVRALDRKVRRGAAGVHTKMTMRMRKWGCACVW